jgi:ABC-type sugar transport system ATPase subunit
MEASTSPAGIRTSTLSLAGIQKRYGETVALAGLDLTIRSGELLGIAGPNGAGKSTLIRILAGEEPADAGEIRLDGALWSPSERFRQAAVVHQEPQLFPNLTVKENLLVSRERYLIGRPKASAAELNVLSELGIREAAGVQLEMCSLVVRQLTEIAKALVWEADVFLFDEPNSALTEEESALLFEHMHALAARGRFVILVSHRVGELVAHAHRVVIIREGRCAAVLEEDALSEEAIARQLVVGESRHENGVTIGAGGAAHRVASLKLEAWTHHSGAFRDVDLEVLEGEIVALVGVEGSGARELIASVAGLEAATGTMAINGRSGAGAARRSTAFLPADRRSSLFEHLSVGENLVARLGIPQIASSLGYLLKRRIIRLSLAMMPRFHVKARSAMQPVQALSGGNQQKVAIAAAIARGPKVLVLEEPTRGVDIGSKAEIYRVLRDFIAAGNAVLIYCTEIPEVFETADKVAIIDRGRLASVLDVHAYADVASLAADIAVLRQHDDIDPAVGPP